ncbi:MAG: proton-conducting transporter membrane subunit [Gaiellaceae bacterium]
MDALLIVLLALPLAAAALAVMGATPVSELATLASGIGSFAVAIALAVSVRHGGSLAILGSWLQLDSLGGVFLLATGLLYAAGSVFSIGYLRGGSGRAGFAGYARRYYAFFNLFGWTMLLVPLMNDFGTLWVAVELTTIVSVLLVAVDRTDAALEAAWKYVLIASVGLGIALLGVVVLYAAGTHALGDAYLPRFDRYLGAGGLPVVPVQFAFLLAVVGFGTKVGLAPMHTWLPDAHSEAPSPVSALLSGALLANAFYAILRFYQVAARAGGDAFPRHVLLVFGTVSLVVAALFVLRQENYKRLLAYSTIEHMGVIALGIGFGVRIAVAGALFHVVNHAAAKGLAFFGSGSLLRRYDTKEIDGVRGAAAALPFSGPMFFAAALALSGLPVSGIFRSEFQIVSGGFSNPAYVWVTLLLVLVNVAFFGVIWHTGRMVLTPAGPSTVRGETSWWMVGGMAACFVVVVGLGFHVPSGFASLLGQAAGSLGGVQ